jgi:flagellar basal body-associated protein FliL
MVKKARKRIDPNKQIKTSVGCLIILVAAIVVILLAIFIPRMFLGSSKENFGGGLRDLIPRGLSITERIGPHG